MNLKAVFEPQSIAIIGASREEKSVGYSLLKNLLSGDYSGKIYPINPHAESILDRACFPSIAAITEPIDLAIIAVPSTIVQKVAEEAVQKQVKALIVISAGFGEQGEEGKKREEQLRQVCIDHDVTLVGPNCLGILNPHQGLNASFETVLPKKGSIAFLSQSGALVSSLIDIATERGVGFSKIISLGNKILLGEHDMLPYLFSDDQTKVIILYAESLKNAPELIGIIRQNLRSSTPKPLILLKAGTSVEGKSASSSHTGALAGSDAAYEALCRQAGIIRVLSIDELLSTAQVLSQNPLPADRHIAIVTNAGGPGIIATDEASRKGLFLSQLTEETKNKLTTILPPASHIANPVDVLGDARSDRYDQVLQIVGNDPHVDCILTIVTPQTMTDIAETAGAIVKVRNTIKKPVVATFMGAPHVEAAAELLSLTETTHIQFPEQAVSALAHAAEYALFVKKQASEEEPSAVSSQPSALKTIQALSQQGVSLVETTTVFDILAQYGIPVVRHALVQSEASANQIAPTLGDVLALKIVSPQISHKTEVGGVLLRVPKEKAGEGFKTILEQVTRNVPEAQTHGVLMTTMVTGEGLEMIVGIKKEPGLGTLIMVGLGGIYVELFHDISFRFSPLNLLDAQEMQSELKAKKILDGMRGKLPLDEEGLVNTLLALSYMAQELPEIVELDINPLFVQPKGQGVLVLDARISLK